jgi:hypothetical protein
VGIRSGWNLSCGCAVQLRVAVLFVIRTHQRLCPTNAVGCVMIVKRAWAQATLVWVIGLVSLLAFYK